MIELFRDVTERKQVEQLRETQLRLSELAIDYTSKELLQDFLDEAEKSLTVKSGFTIHRRRTFAIQIAGLVNQHG